MSSDVEERVMSDEECPLQQLENLKEVSHTPLLPPTLSHPPPTPTTPQESVLASQLQRYALRWRRNLPMTLYMWGLPKDQLSNEEEYTHCVKEKIEQGERLGTG